MMSALARREPAAAGALVLVTSLLTFGFYVPRLGIYYDEWLAYAMFSRLGFAPYLDLAWAQFRPGTAFWMAMQANSVLLGHLWVALVSMSNGLLILWLVRQLLPKVPLLSTLTALLYLVLPLYWIRPTNISLHIEGALLLYLLSYATMISAFNATGSRRWLLTLASLLLLSGSALSYELFMGLEPLRLIVVWRMLHLAPKQRPSVRGLLMTWVPWLAVGASIIGYRLFVFEPGGFYAAIAYHSQRPSLTPEGISTVITAFTPVFTEQLWNGWLTAERMLVNVGAQEVISGVFVGLAVLAYGVGFRRQLAVSTAHLKALLSVLIVGAAMIVLGQATQIAALAAAVPDPSFLSRWHLASSLGVALLYAAAALVASALLSRFRLGMTGGLLLTPLIALGAFYHAHNAERYADDWAQQRTVWWQLAAQAPDVTDGTTIIIGSSIQRPHAAKPFIYIPMIAADLFYGRASVTAITQDADFPDQSTFSIDNGTGWRLSWTYDTRQALIVYLTDAGCLRILDPDAPLPPDVRLSERLTALLPVLPDPASLIVKDSTRAFPERGLFEPRAALPEGCTG